MKGNERAPRFVTWCPLTGRCHGSTVHLVSLVVHLVSSRSLLEESMLSRRTALLIALQKVRTSALGRVGTAESYIQRQR